MRPNQDNWLALQPAKKSAEWSLLIQCGSSIVLIARGHNRRMERFFAKTTA